MRLSVVTGLVAGLLAVVAAPAVAAPVTVDLRIEGATRTLFEGPVTTDVRPFNFTGGEPHACGTAVTSGQVIAAAAEATPFTIAGTWNDGFGSPTFDSVAGENVTFDPGTGRYLGEYLNGVSQDMGSCGTPVEPGDRVLFAYAAFGATALALSGPASARPGETVTLKVTDAADGKAIVGADVAGAKSAADGTVVVGPLAAGVHDFKAEKPEAIRSNRVRVTVAADAPLPLPAPAAAPDTTPPSAQIAGLKEKAVLRRGPRKLSGRFGADPSGIRTVKLRLTKRLGKRCWYFSGRMERFRRTRCGTGAYFAIGDRAEWSYLLPERLTRGRYVFDAIAIDGAGNRTPLERGTTRVVFRVR
jgi:hypothetical protein